MALPDGVDLVVFDMAGTTVDDLVDGEPLVIAAFKGALKAYDGSELSFEEANAVRGYEKREALSRLLGSKVDEKELEKVYELFKQELDRLTGRMNSEVKGSSQVFQELRRRGIKVCVGSGFPEHVVQSIVKNLGWSVDKAFSSVALGAGRPNPVMILKAMELFEISDPKRVVKVGDTKVDIEEARNAGVYCISVLTGTQSRAELEAAGPDCIIGSVAELL